MDDKDLELDDFEIPKKIVEPMTYFGLTSKGALVFLVLIALGSFPTLLVYLLLPIEVFFFVVIFVLAFSFDQSKVHSVTGIMNITYTLQRFYYKRTSKKYRMMKEVNNVNIVEFDYEWLKGDKENENS